MNRTLLTIILSIALLGTLTLAMVLIFMSLDSSKKYCHSEACNQKGILFILVVVVIVSD